jgi:glutamate N-acetyltransferase/amino-acid N-acetyltransferase
MVINTGNANAGTGADGLARARATCAGAGRLLGVAPEQVLPFSTGVIMEPLPVDRIEAGLPAAMADLRRRTLGACGRRHHDHGHPAQGFSAQCRSMGGATGHITGISKGAGMIRPNMATMLGFSGHRRLRAPGDAATGTRSGRPVRSTASRSTAIPRPTTLSW